MKGMAPKYEDYFYPKICMLLKSLPPEDSPTTLTQIQPTDLRA